MEWRGRRGEEFQLAAVEILEVNPTVSEGMSEVQRNIIGGHIGHGGSPR